MTKLDLKDTILGQASAASVWGGNHASLALPVHPAAARMSADRKETPGALPGHSQSDVHDHDRAVIGDGRDYPAPADQATSRRP
jgi:hypothetical protein